MIYDKKGMTIMLQKLKLDEITVVGCRSNGTPYYKENGIMNTDKTDTDMTASYH